MRTTLALLLPALLGVLGYGDDGGGGGGGGTDGGSDSGGGGGGTMCDNGSDRAALEATHPGDGGAERTIQQVARDCALSCISEPEAEQEACSNECIVMNSDVSAGCATCVRTSLACTRDHCIRRCLSAPGGDDCLRCRCGDDPDSANCFDVFTACSGVEADDCDML